MNSQLIHIFQTPSYKLSTCSNLVNKLKYISEKGLNVSETWIESVGSDSLCLLPNIMKPDNYNTECNELKSFMDLVSNATQLNPTVNKISVESDTNTGTKKYRLFYE